MARTRLLIARILMIIAIGRDRSAAFLERLGEQFASGRPTLVREEWR